MHEALVMLRKERDQVEPQRLFGRRIQNLIHVLQQVLHVPEKLNQELMYCFRAKEKKASNDCGARNPSSPELMEKPRFVLFLDCRNEKTLGFQGCP